MTAFETTNWTLVLTASDEQADLREHALESLCQSYWYPLYSYVRRRGNTHADAEELTQDFFVRFIDGQFLAGLSPEKGRFRSFLLVCLKRFLINAHEARAAAKRGGGVRHVPWDSAEAERRYRGESAADQSPDRAYERQWALSVLAEAMGELEAEQVKTSKSERFAELKVYLVDSDNAPSHAQVAARLDLSVGAVKVAVHRLRERYAFLLRQELLRTLGDPTDLEDELAALFSALRP